MWIRLLNHWNLYRSYMYTMQLTKQIHILQSNYLWCKSFPKYKYTNSHLINPKGSIKRFITLTYYIH